MRKAVPLQDYTSFAGQCELIMIHCFREEGAEMYRVLPCLYTMCAHMHITFTHF